MNNDCALYDRFDSESIVNFAKRLVGHSLRDLISCDNIPIYLGKGKLGQLVEEHYFNYSCNSLSEPDFHEVGIELKTVPLKIVRDGKLVAKERLVLSMIDYMEEYKNDFENSKVVKKASKLLLLFYLHDSDKDDVDLLFKHVVLWEFPETDLQIIKQDWNTIIDKIRQGKAHELSEGDTLYLGACTKSTNSSIRRKQPYSDILAKPRAFSLKQKYVNHILEESMEYRSASNTSSVLAMSEDIYIKSFEEIIFEKFSPYFGLTYNQITQILNIPISNAKHKYKILCNNIMGARGNRIEEFDKADIQMKTIRVEADGRVKESMSFENIDYCEIINEEWEESMIFDAFTKRFLFVIFKEQEGDYRLHNLMFWTMPPVDLEKAKEFWEDTKNRIINDDYDHFISMKDDRCFHVRPKGRNNEDLATSPSGRLVPKKCFWINNSYIRNIVENVK